ncbi:unknown [Clostridium sp. CAG:354]|jgi:hypothetical protein|nr:hypothetical protein [Clostridium sp.]MEE0269202.1 hypothetical protein [Clostridia bacterium]OKZ60429.1 MAG: hypothetical protein BHV96_02710 [Clostridium sp. CAG:354_28_25]CDE10082.1 unknown [Clostridium sp. CAG:354]
MIQKSLEIASKVLNISEEILKENYKVLEEDNAILFWEPFRGGRNIIVAEDGTYLVGISAVAPSILLERFRKGSRTGSNKE